MKIRNDKKNNKIVASKQAIFEFVPQTPLSLPLSALTVGRP